MFKKNLFLIPLLLSSLFFAECKNYKKPETGNYLLDISQLQIDFQCIEERGARNSIQVVTSTAQKCMQLCNVDYQGICSVLLWNRYGRSYAMKI